MPGATTTPEAALTLLDGAAIRRWAVLIRATFAARRSEIDELNVFPVPDGDTGTNLFLTFDGALDRNEGAGQQDAGALLAGFASALLWAARGNSGVILSQLARGLAEASRDRPVVDAAGLARGLQRADELAWQAVTDPKDGTILSVSRAAATAAGGAVEQGLHAVAAAAFAAASEALARTPDQLPVLARAGVVDAGGAGYVVLLECLERVCAGDEEGSANERWGERRERRRDRLRPRAGAGRPALFGAGPGQGAATGTGTRPADGGSDDGPTELPAPDYEVMYLLADSSDAAVERLRDRLVELGDSVLVVGGDGQWNVHAHVDDAGAAVEAGIEAGRPHRVRITRLEEADHVAGHAEHAEHAGAAGHGGAVGQGGTAGHGGAVGPGGTVGHGGVVGPGGAVGPAGAVGTDSAGRGGRAERREGPSRSDPGVRTGSAIVACVAGEGLAAVFREAGAAVVASGPPRRASTGQIIEAIRSQHRAGVGGVVVLPNDGDTELAAAAAVRAAGDDGIEAHVVSARTAVQGVAALAVFEPSATASANVLAMQSAASATRHGAVTVATRSALTSAGPCEAGDVLGLVDGDIVVVGHDHAEVGHEVVRRLLASGGELLTVVVGADAPSGLARAVGDEARRANLGLEITVIDGGQPVYAVLLGVE